ncbi:hypothetical protein D3C78_820220 [compost metagenome]
MRVRDQALTHAATTIDDIDDPLGNPGLNGQLRQAEKGKRGEFAWLDDDGAASHQRRCNFPDADHHGKIPRHYSGHHANRFAARERRVKLARGRRKRRGDRFTVDLGCPAGVVTQEGSALADLYPTREVDGFSRAQCLELREFFAVRLQNIRQLVEQNPFLAGQGCRPIAMKRTPCTGYGSLDVFCAGTVNVGDRLPGRRVDDRDALVIGSDAPLSVDEASVVLGQEFLDGG